MEKIKNAKVKIEKVGRIWVHATNPEYNNKAVKIQINEFFTKDFAKENIGKEVELTCKVIIEEGYMGYNVIMYPILKSQQEELEIISAYEFIKENLHWTKKSAEDGKFYITPKVKEKMEMLKGTYKEEIEIILSEYKKIAEEKNKKIIAQKIKSSILKWTAEKAEAGEFYISGFVKENLEKINTEDREEIEKMLSKYKKIAEENAPFYYNFYPDIYLSKDECQKYIGEVVEINGRYGIVKKAYCYKIQGEEECRHPWGSEYTVEMKCEPIPETDDRVIEYKIEKEKKKAYCYKIQGEEECRHPWGSEYTVEMKCEPIPETDDRVIEYKIEKEKRQLEIEKENEYKQEVNSFIQEFKKEFSEEKSIEFSDEEKKLIEAGKQIKIQIEKENEYKQEVNSFIQEFKKEFSEEKSIEFSDEEKKLIEAGKQIKIQGEEIWLTSSDGILHGGGKFLKITENSIWVVTNNGGDGDMWDLNFIYTGGAGGYGYKIQKTERRMEMIKKFKELKITL